MKESTQKLIAFSILFFSLMSLFTCTSCNESKKIQKAQQIVKLNPQAFDNVGKAWAALNFQPPEVLPPVILPGKIEYVNIEKIVTLPVFDSASYAAALDTMKQQYQGKCNEAVDKAFKAGANAMLKELKEKKVLNVAPDTTIYTTVDKKYIKFLLDSIHSQKLITANLQGRYEQLTQELIKSDKHVKTLFYWLFGIGLVVTVGIVLWIVIKLKPL